MSLFLVLLVASANNSDALQKAAEAYSAQQHIGDNVDRYYKSNVSSGNRAKLDTIAMAAHIVIERKLTVCITFP